MAVFHVRGEDRRTLYAIQGSDSRYYSGYQMGEPSMGQQMWVPIMEAGEENAEAWERKEDAQHVAKEFSSAGYRLRVVVAVAPRKWLPGGI